VVRRPHGDRGSGSGFQEASTDPLRREALRALPRVEEATRFVVEEGLVHPSAAVRRLSVELLRERGRFEDWVTQAVRGRVSDEDIGVRAALSWYCSRWNSPEAVPVARALAQDRDAGVRWTAVSSLGSLLSQDAVPDLIEALADESSEVREEAKKSLERIRFYHEEKKRWDDWYAGRGTDPGEGIRKLLEALDDASPAIRIAAIESLGTMKAKEALPRLVQLLKDARSEEIREAASRALARINREE
jgi:HEAT repeat protein